MKSQVWRKLTKKLISHNNGKPYSSMHCLDKIFIIYILVVLCMILKELVLFLDISTVRELLSLFRSCLQWSVIFVKCTVFSFLPHSTHRLKGSDHSGIDITCGWFYVCHGNEIILGMRNVGWEQDYHVMRMRYYIKGIKKNVMATT